MSHSGKSSESRIYVGNLPPDIRSRDVEDLFSKYGKIQYVDLKNKKGPPFAFVEFDDIRDAEDAVRERDGYDYDGYRLRVEFPRSNGSRGGSSSSGSRSGGGRGGGPKPGVGGARRTSYRVYVSGLPPTGSWQDLKDHMREAGDVCYADVYKDGTGVVEYLRHEDMKYALRKLDDSKFRSHEGEVGYIRVREDNGGAYERNGRSSSHSRSRSRSTPPRRTRGSPTYSPARRSRSPSASSSSSPHSRSRTRSRSRSRQRRSRS